jgi:hypothetical protein
MAVGIAVLVTNAVAAGWGAVGWLRSNARAALAFWPLLRVAQASVVVQAVVGLLLLARGITPLFVSLISEGMRAGVAQKELEGVDDVDALERPAQVALARKVALGEMGVMTIGALLILTLALRAYQTGG